MSAAKHTPLMGGRQITRNRTSYSCHTCRRRKVKCDKTHPVCGSCLKNETECVYDATSPKDEALHSGESSIGQGTIKKRRKVLSTFNSDGDKVQHTYTDWKEPSDQKLGSQAIEARLNKLTSMIERLSKTSQDLKQDNKRFLSNSTRESSCQPNGQAARSTSSSRPASRSQSLEPGSDEFPIPAGRATDLVDPVGSLNLGHLSLDDGGRSRYVGTTYWAYISHEINELNQLLRDQNRLHDEEPTNESPAEFIEPVACSAVNAPERSWKSPDDASRLKSENSLSRRASLNPALFSNGESPSVSVATIDPEMLDHVPTRRQSHILYKGFMSGVHAISPVLHPPTTLRAYNAFWDWYDSGSYSGDPCPDQSFIPLLYAIWYGGSVTISVRTVESEFNVSSRSMLSRVYNDEVSRWLTRISFPRSPSLQGLAAYLIVQTILSKEEEPLTSSLFISLSMRVAQTMGLHRDPGKFGIEPCEAEHRRRLWWHIVHMDGVVAMSSGLPPLVGDENFWDVRDTSEVKDTLLGTVEADRYESWVASDMRARDSPDHPAVCGGPSIVNVYYLSARGKYVMARAVRRILRIQLGTKPLTRRDMEEFRSILFDLQLQLNSIISRIPDVSGSAASHAHQNPLLQPPFPSASAESRPGEVEFLGDRPGGCLEQYHSPVLIAFCKWARILLSLFIDKAYCVAYQPFLKNAKSRIWPAARQSAIRRCHGFMEKFISLASDPDFQPFQWSWPGNHQPMHATMIMLIDLYERPYSPEAAKSRAFIDKIFSLSGPDGGVVGGEDGVWTQRPLKDGGREAWNMIRRLRHKAWLKAGLDPLKLWTEKDQTMQTNLKARNEYDITEINSLNEPEWPLSGTRQQPEGFSEAHYNLRHPQASSSFSSATRSKQVHLVDESVLGAPSLPNAHLLHTPAPLDCPLHHLGLGTSEAPTRRLSEPSMSQESRLGQAELTIVTQSMAHQFMDQRRTNGQLIDNALTPPSMIDPSLNFDWDQWDAVFGQHLPVADELMELDPVMGLELEGQGNIRSGLRHDGLGDISRGL